MRTVKRLITAPQNLWFNSGAVDAGQDVLVLGGCSASMTQRAISMFVGVCAHIVLSPLSRHAGNSRGCIEVFDILGDDPHPLQVVKTVPPGPTGTPHNVRACAFSADNQYVHGQGQGALHGSGSGFLPLCDGSALLCGALVVRWPTSSCRYVVAVTSSGCVCWYSVGSSAPKD